MNWNRLLDEQALAALLTAEYTQFARPICEGLAVFLGGLPADVQAKIFADQATLPHDAPLAERLGRLARSSPVLQKLGQVVARDQRLVAELRCQLRGLESLPPTVPLEAIDQILANELGPLDLLSVTLKPPALAEASVAVVVPFQVPIDGVLTEGVFKVLKPGIVERLDLELELLARVGAHLDEQTNELGIPPLNYEDAFEQTRHKLQCEVRFDLERQHLAEAHAHYAQMPEVSIPRVFPELCSPQVIAMERVHGRKVTDHLLECPHEKQRLADLVSRATITSPIFAPAPQAIFHGDPHAGNLLYTTDGRLAMLDWSLAGHLGEVERVCLVQALVGAVTLRPQRVSAALNALTVDGCQRPQALEQVVDQWLRKLRHGHTPGMSWLVGMLDAAVQVAGLRVSAEMLVFRKALHTLEGVVHEIGPTGHWIDDAARSEFVRHLFAEAPLRVLAHPASRAFATRLSNFDLAEVWASAPLAAANYWLAEWSELLQNRWCAPGAAT